MIKIRMEERDGRMKPTNKYRMKKRIAAVIALLVAAAMVLSLIAPFLGYGIY